MPSTVEGERMRIEVVYAEPSREAMISFVAPDGLSVGEYVERSGLYRLYPELVQAKIGFAVFGCEVDASGKVEDGDRIEVLRPLAIDPKDARRRRAKAASEKKGDRQAG
ncbi:RnfH family protein [Thioalkalivibrio sp. HK1]|uniref:RnfH family protein n=1 Tax=Thioalkalivibrio sp. HK1 TaxID=1469245 RepID=UPI0004BC44E9|nr:RnfH family protein [Thioalkalivibrio sp. HK1]